MIPAQFRTVGGRFVVVDAVRLGSVVLVGLVLLLAGEAFLLGRRGSLGLAWLGGVWILALIGLSIWTSGLRFVSLRRSVARRGGVGVIGVFSVAETDRGGRIARSRGSGAIVSASGTVSLVSVGALRRQEPTLLSGAVETVPVSYPASRVFGYPALVIVMRTGEQIRLLIERAHGPAAFAAPSAEVERTAERLRVALRQ